MRFRWLAPLALVAALAVGVVIRSSRGGHHPPATSTSTAPAQIGTASPNIGFARISYLDQVAPSDAGRYREIVLQYGAGVHTLVAAIHRAAPGVKVLLYQDIELARPSDAHGYTVCETSQQTAENPDWSMRDQTGAAIGPTSYPGSTVLNVADPSYERTCAAHALGLADDGGPSAPGSFDGVYFDDVNAFPTGLSPTVSCLRPGPTAPCETAADWENGMVTMITYLAGEMHAHHLVAYGNVGAAVGSPGTWSRLVGPLDGAEQQSFTTSPGGLPEPAVAWRDLLSEIAWSESHQKATLGHSYSSTETGQVYGLATLLLAGGGHSSWITSEDPGESIYPEYATAQALGPPTGAFTTATASGGATVYRRSFSHGLVLVNPPGSPAATVSLGTTYSGSGAEPRDVDSVNLAGASGLILLRDG